MREIQCHRCGKPTIAKTHNAMYCPDCRREEEKDRHRRSYAKKHGVKTAVNLSIAEVAIEARKRGMTYGEYVGRMAN